MEKLISVIVPVYNVEEYVEKCVLSIINQTYKNLEIILVDDGSTDNSGKICDEIAIKDNRIKVIHKKNGGLSDARNVGIDIAKGDYLGFVDSDDYIDPDMYSILLNNMNLTFSDISTCGRVIVNNESYKIEYTDNITKCLTNNEAIKDLFVENNFVYHAAWDKLYKRELFDKIRFPVGRLFEDAAIMYRIFELAKKIVSTKKQLYYYVQRQGSISNCDYNKKKIIHQFENRINSIKYYKKLNNPLMKTYACTWNMRNVYLLWKIAYDFNDNITCDYIHKYTKKYYDIKIYKYFSFKGYIKSIIFIINPKIIRLLKGKNYKQ